MSATTTTRQMQGMAERMVDDLVLDHMPAGGWPDPEDRDAWSQIEGFTALAEVVANLGLTKRHAAMAVMATLRADAAERRYDRNKVAGWQVDETTARIDYIGRTTIRTALGVQYDRWQGLGWGWPLDVQVESLEREEEVRQQLSRVSVGDKVRISFVEFPVQVYVPTGAPIQRAERRIWSIEVVA